jgi:hypothetical protein
LKGQKSAVAGAFPEKARFFFVGDERAKISGALTANSLLPFGFARVDSEFGHAHNKLLEEDWSHAGERDAGTG